jgi:predicted metal-dependent phosphoesterase TrpH
MYKVDLHTHSNASPDGGISEEQYRKALENNVVDYIAITDHNQLGTALELQRALGERIIVGEEIMSSAGEIVGLYLTQRVEPGLTPLETVKQIKDQNGLVYIPHPFETVRKGLHPSMLEELVDYVDLMEVCNGRAFLQNRSTQAAVWARLNHKTGAASSDAHGYHGLGRTFTQVADKVDRDNLLELMAGGTLRTAHPSVRALLYPKYHRLRRKLKKLKNR